MPRRRVGDEWQEQRERAFDARAIGSQHGLPEQEARQELAHDVGATLGQLALDELIHALAVLRSTIGTLDGVVVRGLPNDHAERELQHHRVAERGARSEVEEPRESVDRLVATVPGRAAIRRVRPGRRCDRAG